MPRVSQYLSGCALAAFMIQRPAVADYPPGAVLPARTIDDCELVWMLRGRARLRYGEGEVQLEPGQLVLLPPALRHGFAWDRDRPSRHGFVHFDPKGLGFPSPAEPVVRPMTRHDPLAGLCAYLLWLGHLAPGGWQRRAGETLRLLLSLLLAGPLPATQSPPELGPPLAAALDHLRRAWAQPPLRRVGVAELAAAASVSRGYLGRLFRAGFGVSPGPALECARMARAETLLVRTDLPVQAIARDCGFADASHFSHRFAAIHAVPPTAYRAAGHPATSVLDHPGIRRVAHLLWG
jgi:AraC-like DNA-binding protein